MDFIRHQASDDSAFMGMTHSLSAIALILAVFTFVPALYSHLAPSGNLVMLALVCLVAGGGALLPDLDNTASTAGSELGVFGQMISAFMRTTSPLIQGATSTKYDRKGQSGKHDSAHRGFYHTILSGIAFGALMAFLCSPVISFKLFSLTVDGKLLSLVLAFLSTDLALSAVLGKIWKSKKIMDTIISLSLSAVVAWLLWSHMPNGTSYTLIGISMGLGWIIHLLGDAFTTQGVPLLAPVIKIKGKRWYDLRVLSIKAGGSFENMVFIPLFIIIIVICLWVIIGAHL